MGYYGKIDKTSLAVSLRKKGYSYRQIQKITNLSKSTIAQHCGEIALSPFQIQKLKNNRSAGQMLASIKGAKSNQLKRKLSEKTLIQEGIKQVGEVNSRDRFMIGISLYLGEGSKTGSGVEFTNSDPDTIKFMVRWLEEFCEIKRKDIKAALWLHQNLNEKQSKEFWCRYLDINETQFDKTYFAKNKIDSNKIRNKIHPNGIIKIRYYDVYKLRLILGWIKGVLTNQS